VRLTHVRITNYKSVEDSDLFTIGDVTCLVGKNEAGKTAILQALHNLKPDSGLGKFDIDASYPRRFLSEYAERHPSSPAKVLETHWELTTGEISKLRGILGPNGLTGTIVIVTKSYNEDTTHWTVPVNERETILHLVHGSTLHEEERKQLDGNTTIASLKAAIEALGANITERHKPLLAALNDKFKRGTASTACIDALALPTFFYFSNYDRMSGQVSMEQMIQKKAANTLDRSDNVFTAFLGMVGTSLEDVAKLNQFEPMIAKLESVSNRITREIFSYWSQNKNLKVLFRLDAGRSGDPAPFNSGTILRTRVENTIHEASVSFDDRSTGFVWFFSFLVLFSQMKKLHGKNIILLLDEPGTSLHAKAQADLLRYFKERLLPDHQLIYTTHSPFMVPPDDLMSARTVEDVVKRDEQGSVTEVLGTKVGEDVLSVDRETLFPLQGALGYEITQTLFIGKDSLLVEGPSDILFLKAFSNALQGAGRTSLSPRWTIVPTGGVDKIGAFMSLLYGNKMNIAVFTDLAKGQKKKVEELRKAKLLEENRILTAAEFTGTDQADIEDLIGHAGYVSLVEKAYDLPNPLSIPTATDRVVKDAEDAFRLLPPTTPEFDHFAPASYLITHPEVIQELPDVAAALGRFEGLFKRLNTFLR
jgi:energy-coupling factor transporter ATP-binding protein EcfA2